MQNLSIIKTVRLNPSLNERLQQHANELGIGDGVLIRIAVAKYLGDRAPRAPRRAGTSARIHTPHIASALEG